MSSERPYIWRKSIQATYCTTRVGWRDLANYFEDVKQLLRLANTIRRGVVRQTENKPILTADPNYLMCLRFREGTVEKLEEILEQ